MNTKLAIAAITLTIGSIFSTASFAQSGTLSFTGAIVAPACTGSIANTGTGTASANDTAFSVSLGQCANSDAQVVRTSVFSANADINTDTNTNTERTNNSAIITVTYE